MTALTRASLATLACLAPAPSLGHVGCLSDPMVTFTNGMRLPSTTSVRSHNVYYQCDPGHVGYCDGKLYSPCRNSWRSLGTRCHGEFRPPYGATAHRSVGRETGHSHDGLEELDSESLGVLMTDGPLPEPLGDVDSTDPGLTNPTLTPDGGVWLDTLQTLGRKMMAGEG